MTKYDIAIVDKKIDTVQCCYYMVTITLFAGRAPALSLLGGIRASPLFVGVPPVLLLLTGRGVIASVSGW